MTTTMDVLRCHNVPVPALMILMFTDRCDPLPGLLFYRIRLLTSCKQVKLYEECNFLFTEILSIIGTEG